MKKKGFTLVELLAVIAILAILVIIALPNILNLFNEAKQNTFITEVRTVYKTAQQKFVTNGGGVATFNSGDLDLDGKGLTYHVVFDSQGACNEFWVSDDTYIYVDNSDDLKIENISIETSGELKTADNACSKTSDTACFSEVGE